ncbi:pilus assembly protein [Ensifer sp. B1-9]|uniref:pilus assembly protein n=1 Tax=Ensifer sp. B1-9 TaxID=3141455 RepID=UPI003D1F30CF
MATGSISTREALLLLRRSKRALLVLAATSLISGCADYMNHRDTITFGAGNAMEANKGIHTQDPFPRVAQNTRIATDGKVVSRAIRGYQGGGGAPALVIPPGQAAGSNGSASSN